MTKNSDITAAEKPKQDRIAAAVVILILSLLCAAVILLTRPPVHEENTLFRQGLLAVVVSGRSGWGYINPEGYIVIEQRFSKALNFDENGMALVQIDYKKWGCIDTEGNYVIEPTFIIILRLSLIEPKKFAPCCPLRSVRRKIPKSDMLLKSSLLPYLWRF